MRAKTTHNDSDPEVPVNMSLRIKLLVSWNLVSDQEDLMSIWASHFEAQGKSQESSNCCLKEVLLKVRDMKCASYEESDEVLDTPFVKR